MLCFTKIEEEKRLREISKRGFFNIPEMHKVSELAWDHFDIKGWIDIIGKNKQSEVPNQTLRCRGTSFGLKIGIPIKL